MNELLLKHDSVPSCVFYNIHDVKSSSFKFSSQFSKEEEITRAQIRRQRGCGTTGILCFARYSNANKVVRDRLT
jgi:hypothetical protein